METILLVDDDPGFRKVAEAILTGEGYSVLTGASVADARRLGEMKQFHLVLAGLILPDGEGLDVWRWFGRQSPPTPVIMIATADMTPLAVEAMKQGAAGYLVKPLCSPDELRLMVSRSLEASQIDRERELLREHERARFAGDAPIWRDPVMVETLDLVRKAASTDATVLLTGQRGTGKEVLARCIHANSARAGRAFVPVNCASLPQASIEGELFGLETETPGGGRSQHPGRLEMAHGGTLYLDGIAGLDGHLQSKLMRVLQRNPFERAGGTREITVDVRLIAATDRDLRKMVAEGKFREDLYYRLSAFSVEVPPLRERPADVPALARLFLSRAAKEMGKNELDLASDAIEALLSYSWPGNVRELENAMQRAAILCDSEVRSQDLPIVRANGTRPMDWGQIERKAIEDALRANNGNRTRAARQLGISLRKLQYRLKEYGLRLAS